MTKHQGNFFSLPNDIFELELSASAFLVYCYLRRCANRKTHQCYPSYETIGEAVGLCKNTVQKCICELVDMGLIHTENTSVITKNGLKHNGNLLYTIQPVQNVLEAHHQNQLRKLKQKRCLQPTMLPQVGKHSLRLYAGGIRGAAPIPPAPLWGRRKEF